jgi:outer membrane protein W
MRKQLLTAIAVAASLCGYAQTKGTNMLGLGVTVYSSASDYNIASGNSSQKQKSNSFSLGYGYFIADNSRLGVNLLYGHNTSRNSNDAQDNTTDSYGANLSYQRYYPLVGKLYAYAGGSGGYIHSKLTYDAPTNVNEASSDNYSLGAFGGVTWFITKRWAFETTLLSATAGYLTTDQTDGSGTSAIYKNKQTNFSLKTDGIINDLSFKIYLTF